MGLTASKTLLLLIFFNIILLSNLIGQTDQGESYASEFEDIISEAALDYSEYIKSLLLYSYETSGTRHSLEAYIYTLEQEIITLSQEEGTDISLLLSLTRKLSAELQELEPGENYGGQHEEFARAIYEDGISGLSELGEIIFADALERISTHFEGNLNTRADYLAAKFRIQVLRYRIKKTHSILPKVLKKKVAREQGKILEDIARISEKLARTNLDSLDSGNTAKLLSALAESLEFFDAQSRPPGLTTSVEILTDTIEEDASNTEAQAFSEDELKEILKDLSYENVNRNRTAINKLKNNPNRLRNLDAQTKARISKALGEFLLREIKPERLASLRSNPSGTANRRFILNLKNASLVLGFDEIANYGDRPLEATSAVGANYTGLYLRHALKKYLELEFKEVSLAIIESLGTKVNTSKHGSRLLVIAGMKHNDSDIRAASFISWMKHNNAKYNQEEVSQLFMAEENPQVFEQVEAAIEQMGDLESIPFIEARGAKLLKKLLAKKLGTPGASTRNPAPITDEAEPADIDKALEDVVKNDHDLRWKAADILGKADLTPQHIEKLKAHLASRNSQEILGGFIAFYTILKDNPGSVYTGEITEAIVQRTETILRFVEDPAKGLAAMNPVQRTNLHSILWQAVNALGAVRASDGSKAHYLLERIENFARKNKSKYKDVDLEALQAITSETLAFPNSSGKIGLEALENFESTLPENLTLDQAYRHRDMFIRAAIREFGRFVHFGLMEDRGDGSYVRTFRERMTELLEDSLERSDQIFNRAGFETTRCDYAQIAISIVDNVLGELDLLIQSEGLQGRFTIIYRAQILLMQEFEARSFFREKLPEGQIIQVQEQADRDAEDRMIDDRDRDEESNRLDPPESDETRSSSTIIRRRPRPASPTFGAPSSPSGQLPRLIDGLPKLPPRVSEGSSGSGGGFGGSNGPPPNAGDYPGDEFLWSEDPDSQVPFLLSEVKDILYNLRYRGHGQYENHRDALGKLLNNKPRIPGMDDLDKRKIVKELGKILTMPIDPSNQTGLSNQRKAAELLGTLGLAGDDAVEWLSLALKSNIKRALERNPVNPDLMALEDTVNKLLEMDTSNFEVPEDPLPITRLNDQELEDMIDELSEDEHDELDHEEEELEKDYLEDEIIEDEEAKQAREARAEARYAETFPLPESATANERLEWIISQLINLDNEGLIDRRNMRHGFHDPQNGNFDDMTIEEIYESFISNQGTTLIVVVSRMIMTISLESVSSSEPIESEILHHLIKAIIVNMHDNSTYKRQHAIVLLRHLFEKEPDIMNLLKENLDLLIELEDTVRRTRCYHAREELRWLRSRLESFREADWVNEDAIHSRETIEDAEKEQRRVGLDRNGVDRRPGMQFWDEEAENAIRAGEELNRHTQLPEWLKPPTQEPSTGTDPVDGSTGGVPPTDPGPTSGPTGGGSGLTSGPGGPSGSGAVESPAPSSTAPRASIPEPQSPPAPVNPTPPEPTATRPTAPSDFRAPAPSASTTPFPTTTDPTPAPPKGDPNVFNYSSTISRLNSRDTNLTFRTQVHNGALNRVIENREDLDGWPQDQKAELAKAIGKSLQLPIDLGSKVQLRNISMAVDLLGDPALTCTKAGSYLLKAFETRIVPALNLDPNTLSHEARSNIGRLHEIAQSTIEAIGRSGNITPQNELAAVRTLDRSALKCSLPGIRNKSFEILLERAFGRSTNVDVKVETLKAIIAVENFDPKYTHRLWDASAKSISLEKDPRVLYRLKHVIALRRAGHNVTRPLEQVMDGIELSIDTSLRELGQAMSSNIELLNIEVEEAREELKAGTFDPSNETEYKQMIELALEEMEASRFNGTSPEQLESAAKDLSFIIKNYRGQLQAEAMRVFGVIIVEGSMDMPWQTETIIEVEEALTVARESTSSELKSLSGTIGTLWEASSTSVQRFRTEISTNYLELQIENPEVRVGAEIAVQNLPNWPEYDSFREASLELSSVRPASRSGKNVQDQADAVRERMRKGETVSLEEASGSLRDIATQGRTPQAADHVALGASSRENLDRVDERGEIVNPDVEDGIISELDAETRRVRDPKDVRTPGKRGEAKDIKTP
ncbi:MAG: hypothetical protein ABIA04_03960 [Pseudomonadota bacterium]